jgi:hypothetical protein
VSGRHRTTRTGPSREEWAWILAIGAGLLALAGMGVGLLTTTQSAPLHSRGACFPQHPPGNDTPTGT